MSEMKEREDEILLVSKVNNQMYNLEFKIKIKY